MRKVTTITGIIVGIAWTVVLCIGAVSLWNFSHLIAVLTAVIIVLGVLLFTFGLVKSAARVIPTPSASSNEALTRPNVDKYYDYDPYGDVPGDYDR